MVETTVALIYLAIWGVIGLGALVGTIFWIIELVDVMRREFADATTKLIWVLVILFGHLIGSLVYYFVGRSQGHLPGQAPRIYQ